jgi:hypothetical protein
MACAIVEMVNPNRCFIESSRSLPFSKLYSRLELQIEKWQGSRRGWRVEDTGQSIQDMVDLDAGFSKVDS